jgi:hypothetical protein
MKPFLPITLLEWTQLLSYLLSGIGIILAGSTYYYNRKLKRAEWLKSLFEKFYQNSDYKDVRKWIDFDKDDKLLQIALSEDKGHVNEEKLADFLNFFEFIATLESEHQITLSEIRKLFAYYIKLIKTTPKCTEYIVEFEFKNLQILLSKL